MILETERLRLIVLNARQLELWIQNLPQLERELTCTYRAEPTEGIFREIIAGQLAATKQDPENDVWHSFWFLIRKTDGIVVGSADFKDIPDENGCVEIGYGLGKDYEHHGYMTETVYAMCNWALQQPGVQHIIAETDLDGFSSQRLLQRCGFQLTKSGETLWWKL